MTTSTYIPVRVDMRGSMNLPADIKARLGITLGSTLLVRQVHGVILVVPFSGEAEQAAQTDTLHSWVSQQLGMPQSEAPVTSTSKTATAEAIRLQASRERHQQRMALVQEKIRLAEIQALSKQPVGRPPEPVPAPRDPTADPAPAGDFFATLMKQRQEDADRSLNEALAKASEEMAGEHTIPFNPPLPQA
jgi:hypothetical protein